MTARTAAVLKTVQKVVDAAQEHMQKKEHTESIENFELAAETVQSVMNAIEVR